MDKKISVIVPIYNVEKYLKKCIDSIVNQTYKNLEIILVDDGSPDNCSQICDEYEKNDERIKVIHKKNGGLSDARNAGLEICTGDFISFVDSDDWISTSMYEILVKTLHEYNADIVECKFNVIKEKEHVKNINNDEVYIYNTEQALEALITTNNLNTVVWNKLYRKEVLNNIVFEVNKINEDDFFTYLVLANSNKVISINKYLYYYVYNSTSIINRKYSIKRLDELEAKLRRFKYIKNNYESLELICKLDLLFSSLYSYQKLMTNVNFTNIIKGRKIIKKYIKEVTFSYDELKKLDLKTLIYIVCTNISLDLTCLIRNLLKIGI